MPVANCFIRRELISGADTAALTSLWAEESGTELRHMTVNLVELASQQGADYPVMAFLHLPSLWSRRDAQRLQLGLAHALSRTFALDSGQVHVITSIVEPGHVVEDGEIQEW